MDGRAGSRRSADRLGTPFCHRCGKELRQRQRALAISPAQEHCRIQRQQRGGQIGRVHGVAGAAAEERVELVLPLPGRALLAALQPAVQVRIAEVPAAGALQQVPAECGHVAQLGVAATAAASASTG